MGGPYRFTEKDKMDLKDNEFCIVTPERIYRLEAIDANQKIEWVQKIEALLPQSDHTGCYYQSHFLDFF